MTVNLPSAGGSNQVLISASDGNDVAVGDDGNDIINGSLEPALVLALDTLMAGF